MLPLSIAEKTLKKHILQGRDPTCGKRQESGERQKPRNARVNGDWAPRHCQEEEHGSNKTQLCDVHATGIFMRWLMCTLSITWLQCKFPHTFIWEGKNFPQLSGLDWLSPIVLHSICGVSGSSFWIYLCICFCWVSSSTWNLENFTLINCPRATLAQPSQSSGPSTTALPPPIPVQLRRIPRNKRTPAQVKRK